MIYITITIGTCYGMAELLASFKVESLISAGVISATLGLGLHGVAVKNLSHDQPTKISSSVSVLFKYSILFGFFDIFLLGSVWHLMAIYELFLAGCNKFKNSFVSDVSNDASLSSYFDYLMFYFIYPKIIQ